MSHPVNDRWIDRQLDSYKLCWVCEKYHPEGECDPEDSYPYDNEEERAGER